MLIPLIFFCILGYLVVIDEISSVLLWTYIIISVLTFIVYAWDKAAARKGKWRIKEKTLHIFALIGGWPGAVMAQKILRHKSIKRSFRMIFWLTVILNIAVLIWFLFSDSGAILKSFYTT